jgi:nicotinamide mononucleotide adenylyltransferase
MVIIGNMGLRFTVTNPDTNRQRARPLDLRLFKTRDKIRAQCARVVHIDTSDNSMDMFT